MIIKSLYLVITAFMISIGLLKKKLTNKEKAISYITFTTGWCFGVFGVSLMFKSGAESPPDMLFYIAIIPSFIATALLIRSIR